ncbi:SH3 domain-containing protein [Roseivivax sp. CAU 1761]
MSRFIILTFAFMFWGFYEMSGGADFEPGWTLESARADDAAAQPEVARADTTAALTGIAIGAAQAATATPEQIAPAEAALDVPLARRDEAPAPLLIRAAAMGPGADAPEMAPRPRLRSTADMPSNAEPNTRAIGPAADLRVVKSSRVNMRSGPGTQYSVLAQLTRGDEVEVLRQEGSWIKLRVAESGRIGWMADFLIAAAR